MANNLKFNSATGNLLRSSSSGNLRTCCCPESSCECGCPATSCEDCSSTYTLTVSGFATGAGSDCCSGLNPPNGPPDGMYTMTQQSGSLDCKWVGPPFGFNVGLCDYNSFLLYCSTSDVTGNPYPDGCPRWVVVMYPDPDQHRLCVSPQWPYGAYVWAEKKIDCTSPVCPPTGEYTITCYACGAGGSPSMVLS